MIIYIKDKNQVTEFHEVPKKVAKAIATILHECENDSSTIMSAEAELFNENDEPWEG